MSSKVRYVKWLGKKIVGASLFCQFDYIVVRRKIDDGDMPELTGLDFK